MATTSTPTPTPSVHVSFFSRIKTFLEKLFGSTTWMRVASNTLAIAAPLAETIVALVAGAPVEAAVSAVVSKIQAGLTEASTAIAAAQNPNDTTAISKVQAALSSVQSNLPELLQAAQVKDPDTAAKITAVVDTLDQEISAILNALPAATNATS